MPGQIKRLQNLVSRLRVLSDGLIQTADLDQRERIKERIDEVRAELHEWREQAQRDADAGDSEAKILIGILRQEAQDMMDEQEG